MVVVNHQNLDGEGGGDMFINPPPPPPTTDDLALYCCESVKVVVPQPLKH